MKLSSVSINMHCDCDVIKFVRNCVFVQRSSLSQLILKVKMLDLGEPKAILALALSPPRLDGIERTIVLLKEVSHCQFALLIKLFNDQSLRHVSALVAD